MLLSRAQPLPLRALSALLRRGEPLLLDPDLAESLGGALALLAPFLRKGSSAALDPRRDAERAARDDDDHLAPSRSPCGRRDHRDRALDRRPGGARDRQRPSLRPAEGVRGHDAAVAAAARGPGAAGARARRRLRVGRARRGRRRRLRLPHARRRPARRRPRRRHGPRRRRDRRHGDGEVRLPLARPRAPRSRHVPRRRERGRLVGDRAGTLHHDGRGRLRRRRWGGRVRQRRPSAAAAGAPGRKRPVGLRRAGSRSGSTRRRPTTRSRSRSRPARSSSSTPTASIEARRGGEQFGVERLDALLAERRDLPPPEIAQAALAACRDWTEGELTDDFAVVVVKRSPQPEDTAA